MLPLCSRSWRDKSRAASTGVISFHIEWNVDEAEDFVDVGGDFVTNVDAAGVESVGVASLVIAAISACGITTKKIAVTAAVVVGDAINAE